jgi:hypothetical protein
MRWAGHVARRGYRRGAYRVLVGKPEGGGEIPLVICRHRWEGNFKLDLQEVVRAFVHAAVNLRVEQGVD